MELYAFMMEIEWDYTQDALIIGENKYDRRIKKIREVKSQKIGTKLGEEKENEDWYTYSHYRENKGDLNFSQIGFKIVEFNPYSNLTDLIDNISFYIYLSKDKQLTEMFIDKEQGYIYEKPYFKSSKKYDFKNEMEFVPSGIKNSGAFYIVGLDKNNREVYKSPRIYVKPSSISDENYRTMVEDIIMISEDLIMNSKSKLGLRDEKSFSIEKIEEFIKNVEYVLKRLNKNPSTELIRDWEYRPINSIKRFDTKTLIDYLRNPSKNKYLVATTKESKNTYENSVIKYYLERLDAKVAELKEFNNRKEKEKYDAYLYNQFDYLRKKDFNVDRVKEEINQTKDRIKKINEKVDEIIKQDSIETNAAVCNKELLYVKLWIEINRKPSVIRFNEHLNSTNLKSSYNDDINKWDIELLEYQYSTDGKKYQSVKPNSLKINKLELRNNSIGKNIFLVRSLSDISNIGRTIKIFGICTVNNNRQEIGEDIFGSPNSNSIYNNYEFNLVDIIEIKDQKCPNYSLEEKKEFVINNTILGKELENNEEYLGFLNSIELSLVNYKDMMSKIQCNYLRWEKCSEAIGNLLNLEFLRSVESKVHNIRPTQIFTNDANYSIIWKNIVQLREDILWLDEDLGDDINLLLADTQCIFEVWSLFKMVSLLVDLQGWELIDTDISASILKNLQEKGKLEGAIFKLRHKISRGNGEKLVDQKEIYISLDIEYNGNFKDNRGITLRPDYRLVFNNNINVYLDAKYKNYDEQPFDELKNDIVGVAIEKYINRFKNTINSAEASFIVHSHDSNNKYVNLGGYYDKKIASDLGLINTEYIPANHRFGYFPLLPNNVHYFLDFMKMIMEYKLGYYFTCWNCGESRHEKIQITTKLTMSNYEKYHCECRTCNEFWVKTHCITDGRHDIIKHVHNYHTLNSNDKWWVKCPQGCDDH